jgi:two-component SAPR family response regulator
MPQKAPIRTVIIDDEDDAIRTVKLIISGAKEREEEYFSDIEVVGVGHDVDEGIALYDDMKPDLCLIDVDLRTGTGFEVAQHIRSFAYEQQPEIVFISSYPQFSVPINLHKPIQTRSKLSSCFTERPIGRLSTGIDGRTART